MKKVLAIAPYPYLPYYSGGQKFIAQFFEWLGKEVDLTVISTEGNDFSLAKTYKTIPLLKKSFSRYYDLSLVQKISTIVTEGKFDTIIWEHPYYSWLAFRVRKSTGVKTIIHTHNIEYQRFQSTGRWWWPILKAYEKRCFKKADAIFFITPEDKNFAIDKWKIEKEKCIDLPFGVDIKENPTDKPECREIVAQKYSIGKEEKILLFSGLLNYKPNLDALKIILEKINPLLLSVPSFNYKIIICGKGLPEEMNDLKEYADKNIIYAGFVREIETYTKAADIFLNPVLTGGGIKTKMVEAIAYGATVISTKNGAIGIDISVCEGKLFIADDNDWKNFANLAIEQAAIISKTSTAYYNTYYWERIVKKVILAVSISS